MARTKATAAKKSVDNSKTKEEAPGGVKKRTHRWKPGTVALREIRRYQKSTDNLIPRAPMNRLIDEIATDMLPSSSGIRFKAEARDALHLAAEDYLTSILNNTNKLAIGRKAKTISTRDMKLLSQLNLSN